MTSYNIIFHGAVILITITALLLPVSEALVVTKNQPAVSKLLETYRVQIDQLKDICVQTVGTTDFQRQPYCNDVFYLRYCLGGSSSKDEAINDPITKFKSNLQWRMSEEGKRICSAATSAIEQATADNNKWSNEPVLKNAPYSTKITKYITPSCAMTTITNQNDLVYCIRAGSIDDNALMNNVSIDEMVQFFLYAKEINAIVANMRSIQYDKLISIITCNDLSGVKLIGGSNDFRKALSKSSTQANEIYPSSYTGPTLLLNLPSLLSALVKLFTPLFPESVRERLKFIQGPLKNIPDLRTIAYKAKDYEAFAKELDGIVY